MNNHQSAGNTKPNGFFDVRPNKKICLISNGCPENRIDTARMQEFFKGNSWTVIKDYRDADIIIFNACGLTQAEEEGGKSIINQIKANKKPSAELIVSGCLPKINKSSLREVYQGITFSSGEIERIPEIYKTRINPKKIRANYLIPLTQLRLPYKLRDLHFNVAKLLIRPYRQILARTINVYNPHTFCIKISTGCLGSCSYCAIRFSRGRVKSKSIDQIIDEFEDGLSKGFKEFALLGTDVGSYGRDQDTNLVDLLHEMVKRKGDYEIKIRNIQPRFLIEMMAGLLEILQSGKIKYISSGVQSGNNRILELMKRGYKIEDYIKAIHTLNREYPEILIRTQLMVAFPGETEKEFQDTIRLLDQVRIDYIEVYKFSPRPNTDAAIMRDQIPTKVARMRYRKLYFKALILPISSALQRRRSRLAKIQKEPQ